MSRNLINIGFKFRNSGATYVPKEGLSEVKINREIFDKMDNWLKWNKMNYLPEFICPSWAKRVTERPKPSYARLILKKERSRKKDREIIRSFCNHILYKEGKHKPF